MQMQQEREQLAEFAKRMRPDSLTVGTSGNLSIRSGDQVAITPSGLDYDDMTPELICVVDLDGKVVEAQLDPSSEIPMHTSVYRESDAGAVVHTHPSYATSLSLVVDELPAVHYLIGLFGGPVRVAPFAMFGSEQLAKNMGEALEGRTAVILQNHGASTIGDSLEKAYTRAIYLEQLSQIYYQARLIGEPHLLDMDTVAEAIDKLASYGQSAPPA